MRFPTSRFFMAAIAMVTACVTWAQAIYFDGHKAVHDNLTDTWLCSVPREAFESEWMPVVTFDSTMTNVTIDGQAVLNEDQIILQGVTGGHLYPLRANIEGGEVINGNLTFTWLPVLELNGEFGNEYSMGTVSLNDPDGTSKEDMLAKLKWRGGITNNGDRHKRNYHIKFVDSIGEKKNRRLLGMRKDNHWKLDAGQIDPLRIRNRVAADLWLDMSRDPWFKSIDSTVINGSRGRVTELFLNGEYYGIYGLIEPVDRKQLGLVKHDTVNNVFHGQQWVSKQWARTYTYPYYNNNSDMWNKNEVNYPEFEDVHPTDWSTFYNSFEFVRRNDAVDDWQTLADSLDYYYDTPVMEDYFILLVTLQALDNETKNIYYSLYDKASGDKRLVYTPWDLDVSLGAKTLSGLTNAMVQPERNLDWVFNLPLVDMFYGSVPHRKQIIDRYWELRETWLDTDNLIARFQAAVDELENSGAAAREEARWSGDSDINGKTLDISAEMEYVANWIQRRMDYLDANIFVRPAVLPGDVNEDGTIDISDVTTLINYCLCGGTINVANSDYDGSGAIDISDVTSLINYLLNGN
ncbi:MAG: CotH kinase family protein [Muribaculaceae bacterium]|nr:CotH kinase family protein [Muribaculaceae bacterium]